MRVTSCSTWMQGNIGRGAWLQTFESRCGVDCAPPIGAHLECDPALRVLRRPPKGAPSTVPFTSPVWRVRHDDRINIIELFRDGMGVCVRVDGGECSGSFEVKKVLLFNIFFARSSTYPTTLWRRPGNPNEHYAPGAGLHRG